MLLTIDGVWLATPGYTDGLEADEFTPIKETIASFIKNGGQLWVCGACMKPARYHRRAAHRRRSDGRSRNRSRSDGQWCEYDQFLKSVQGLTEPRLYRDENGKDARHSRYLRRGLWQTCSMDKLPV